MPIVAAHMRIVTLRSTSLPSLLILALTPSCTTSRVTPAVAPPEQHAQSASDGWIPVARYGRYTLVELAPDVDQRDLLQQVVDFSAATSRSVTVGDALRQSLLASGYTLCEESTAEQLYALPLPASHMRLGPLVLRDGLITLAGPAWQLQVDDLTRRVCFTPAVGDATGEPLAPRRKRADRELRP